MDFFPLGFDGKNHRPCFGNRAEAFSASLCKLVENYAEILASQGLLSTAMEYLKLLGGEELSPELAILKDRIAVSSENGMCFCFMFCYLSQLDAYSHCLCVTVRL